MTVGSPKEGDDPNSCYAKWTACRCNSVRNGTSETINMRLLSSRADRQAIKLVEEKNTVVLFKIQLHFGMIIILPFNNSYLRVFIIGT